MTKSQYLEMMEQMNEEPNWEKCPPDWDDFPQIVIDSINLYHSMGDRIYPDIGYIGKDFTNFEFYIKHFGIENYQIDFVVEIIQWMDRRAIEISQRRLKAERDRYKRGK
jgi:hypothetical protein